MTKGEETRAKIITSAIQLFNSEGINWMSFQMLAKKVGVSQPAIYIYFADKDDLIIACVQDVIARGQKFIEDFVNPQVSARKRLHGYIEGNLRWILSRPKEAELLLVVYSGGSFNPKYKVLHEFIDKSSMARIANHLFQEQYEDKIKSSEKNKKITVKARLIHNILVGEMIKTLRWPGQMPANTRVKTILEWVDSIK